MNLSKIGLCTLACGLFIPKASYAQSKKMNVIFFLVDDVRWNSLHCMGTDFLVTPNIDSLAKDGILFNNAFATTAISCVSRASLLTGQYMSRHHVVNFRGSIPEAKFGDTYPGQMRKNSYWTGHVGKYGIGRIRKEDYDYTNTYLGYHWYPANKESKRIQLGGGYTKIQGDSIHVTEKDIENSLTFLKERPKDKPFCLSVSFFAPHAVDGNPLQYRYQPSSSKYYKDVTIPTPYTAKDKYLKRLPPFIQSEQNEGRIRWHWRFDTPEHYQTMMKAYYRMITEIDLGIGRVVKELKKEGLYDNTLIIFMGDNGYFQSEHQLADKWYPYEESIRVPLIIYDPRIPENQRGKKEKNMVLNIDIAPTILSAAGIKVPKVMQGKDLSELYLYHKKNSWRQDFYYEHPTILNVKKIPSSEALITKDKRYIYWPDYDTEEFFDISKDPYEINNSIANPKYKKTIRKMKLRFNQLKNLAK